MLEHIIQIDKDIIEINYYTDVEKIWKNVIYELLEDCRGISQIKIYNHLFKGLVASTESCLLFVPSMIHTR